MARKRARKMLPKLPRRRQPNRSPEPKLSAKKKSRRLKACPLQPTTKRKWEIWLWICSKELTRNPERQLPRQIRRRRRQDRLAISPHQRMMLQCVSTLAIWLPKRRRRRPRKGGKKNHSTGRRKPFCRKSTITTGIRIE